MTIEEQRVFYAAIGEKISHARKKARYKQEVFAELIGLSRSSVVNIEQGRQHPSVHLLWDISSVLKIKLTDLLPNSAYEDGLNRELTKEINRLPKSENETKVKLKEFLKELNPAKPKKS